MNNGFCHVAWYGVAYLRILHRLGAMELIAAWERLDEGGFSNCNTTEIVWNIGRFRRFGVMRQVFEISFNPRF